MSTIKESLEANSEEILENLPKEFHEDFKKEVEAATEVAPQSPEEELEAIKAEMTANPACDEAALIAEVEQNPTGHRSDPLPSAEEQESAMKEALANVSELTAPEQEG